jgi:hypothetical protein
LQNVGYSLSSNIEEGRSVNVGNEFKIRLKLTLDELLNCIEKLLKFLVIFNSSEEPNLNAKIRSLQ